MKKVTFTIALIIWLSLFAYGQKASADLILFNGKIFTSDLAKPSAEAVAIRGERIVAVGTNNEVGKLANTRTRKIDLQGRVVLPGLNDAHFHFTPDPRSGYNLQFKSLEPSWEETATAIEAAVKQSRAGTWIFGTVGSNVVLNEQITRFSLDKIAPNNPILLRAFYGHGYIANSKALPLLEINEEEPDPAGGYFERVADSRKINGRFWEYAEWKPSRILANQVSDADAILELKKMADEAVGFGITSMQIMSSMPVDRFARLLVRADLPIRTRAISFSLTDARGRDMSEIRQLSKLKFTNSKVKVSGIKWILDGTPFERGAALRQPYNDRPDWSGKLNFSESEIVKMVKESLRFKQQILFHCAGDRSAEAVLDALEQIKNVDWKTKRVRIEHGDGVSGDLIARAKKLGVIIVQNPTHFSTVEMIYSRYSPNTKFLMARSLIENDIPFAIGSDGPMNPFLNIMLAAIPPAQPTEAITREQAVRAYTHGSAFAEFSENEKGTITTGKLADLVVLSQDVFTAPVPDLPKVNSILTIVGGKIVYDAKTTK